MTINTTELRGNVNQTPFYAPRLSENLPKTKSANRRLSSKAHRPSSDRIRFFWSSAIAASGNTPRLPCYVLISLRAYARPARLFLRNTARRGYALISWRAYAAFLDYFDVAGAAFGVGAAAL